MPSTGQIAPLQQRLFSTAEAAHYLNTSPRTVGRLVAAGELRVIRYFKYYKFDRQDLDDFVDRLK